MEEKIAHITDLHQGEIFPIENGVNAEKNWEYILQDIDGKNIDRIVFTGDIGTENSLEWFFSSINNHKLPVEVTLGNHDNFLNIIEHQPPNASKEKDGLYYSYEKGHFKFIYLDSSSSHISPSQFQWFQHELNTDKKIILFIHHPILETGTTPQKEYPLENSEEVKQELLKHKNDVYIFCGHLHFHHEQREQNIIQYTTPAACYQTKKFSATTEKDNINFGYRIIHINEDDLSTSEFMFTPNEIGNSTD